MYKIEKTDIGYLIKKEGSKSLSYEGSIMFVGDIIQINCKKEVFDIVKKIINENE